MLVSAPTNSPGLVIFHDFRDAVTLSDFRERQDPEIGSRRSWLPQQLINRVATEG